MKKSREQLHRERLFDIYAPNLDFVKKSSSVRIEPDIEDTILCPMCQSLFDRDDLSIPNVITLDHVPPESLGGKIQDSVLMCRTCNNDLGTTVDSQLGKTLSARDFAGGLPNSSIDAKLSFNDLPLVNVTLTRSDKECLMIAIGDHKRVNPKDAEQLKYEFDRMQESSTFVSNFSFLGGKYQQTNVALLRIAYLMFFRLFGYGAILNPHMDQVRNQIIEPEKLLLPPTWNFPMKLVGHLEPGISIITSPNELRAFLAIFDLIRPTGSSRHGVLLPTLDDEGQTLYQRLDSLDGKPFNCEMHGKLIEPNLAFWTDPKEIFKAHRLSLLK